MMTEEQTDTKKQAEPLSKAEKLIYYGNTAFVILGITSYIIVIFAQLLNITPLLIFFFLVPVFYKWAVSLGLFYAVIQGFYGLLQYIRTEDNLYLNHCWSALMCAWMYFVLFVLRGYGLYIAM